MDQQAVQRAMAELVSMKEEIARLQKQRDDAEKSVQQAKSSIERTKKNSVESSIYSDQNYWEDRYGSLNDDGKGENADVYEWYASYKEIRDHIKEDVHSTRINIADVEFLVSGCGNSTLCEELYHDGMKKVTGMDYSPRVITLMEQRAQTLHLSGLQYFQADARNMPHMRTGHYDIVLDKGTLDAIATEGASTDNQQVSVDAINYMLEIWRVLKIGGLLVLISTMPPEILEPMAIAPIEQQDSSAIDSASSPVVNSDGHDQQPHSYRHSSGGDGGVSNWKAGSRVQQLTTAEGGTVYYYTIRKLTNTSKVTTFHPAAATTTTTSTTSTTTPTATAKGASALKEKSTKDNKSGVGRKGDTKGYECVKEDIMAGITALLEEARKAKEQMEAAASKQEQAAREVQEVEHKRSALEKTLQTGLQDIGESEGHELLVGSTSATKTLTGLSHSTDAHVQAAIESAVKELAPEVKLFLDTEQSSLTAGETLDVYYVLRLAVDISGGSSSNSRLSAEEVEQLLQRVWQEEDSVCLVARPSLLSGGAAGARDALLYQEGHQPYETFEYTEKPVLLSIAAISTTSSSAIGHASAGVTCCESETTSEIARTLLRLGASSFISPQTSRKHHFFVGKVHMRLPVVGGAFHVSYVRTATLPADAVTLQSSGASGKVVERRIKLAESASFASKVRVLGAHPDSRNPAAQVLFPSPKMLISTVPNVRRRGAGVLISTELISMWVEDMPHIKTLNVVTVLRPASSATHRCCLSRAMAWAVPAPVPASPPAFHSTSQSQPNTAHSSSSLNIIVEVDVIAYPADSTPADSDGATVSTVYGILECCDEVFSTASLDLGQAHGQLDDLGRFTIRMPYSVHTDQAPVQQRDPIHDSFHSLNSALLGSGSELSTAAADGVDENKSNLQVRCASCKTNILLPNSIQHVRPLPTGLLDEMMHDFICCELPSDNASMETASMTTPPQTLLHGSMYASIHPDHLKRSSVHLSCKTHSTILDISTSWGRAIASRGIITSGAGSTRDTIGQICAKQVKGKGKVSEKGLRQEYLRKLRSAVNVETCAIRCQRCDNYLGDGYLQGEPDGSSGADTATAAEAAAAAANASATSAGSSSSGGGGGSASEGKSIPTTAGVGAPFSMADVRDVRFALHNVHFSVSSGQSSMLTDPFFRFSTEQMVTRTFLQLSEGHGFNSICLYVGDADLENMDRTGRVEGQAIVLKLISTSFRISSRSALPTETAPAVGGAKVEVQVQVRLCEAVKVAFRTGEILDVITGTEPRVPIQYHELAQLNEILTERTKRMGPSPLKGFSLAFVLK